MRRLIILLLVITSAWCGARADDNTRAGKVRAEGAIVCRSLAMVAFMKQQMAGRKPPDFNNTGCTLLPEGAPVTIEQTDQATIVNGETLFGAKVRGVTDPAMIEF